MAQVLDAPRQSASHSSIEPNQFEYRPVPVHAVVSVTLGVLGATSLLSVTGVAIALLGILVSGFSVWRIVAAGGVLGGRTIAICGLAFSILFFSGGIAWQTYLYRTEVPEGFQRVSFTNDISRKGFVTTNGQPALHEDVEPLVGQELFLKGFIYPTSQEHGLQAFLLVKDSGICCFGKQPAPQDMIGVVMEGDQTIDYSTGLMAVSGTLQINPNASLQSGEPVYMMTGRIVTKARSSL